MSVVAPARPLVRAVASNTADPIGRGRIKVQAGSLFGGRESDWAEPSIPGSSPPGLGAPVYIAFEDGDPARPVWLSGGSGGGGAARATSVYTTAALVAGQTEQGLVTLARGYRVLAITTDVPARVRLYSTAASRSADLTRAPGAYPAPGCDIVLDYLTYAGLGTPARAVVAPQAIGSNMETEPSSAIPITVSAVGDGVVVITLVWSPMEI